ncbi:MAG: hypothetical protein CMN64_04470 [Sphingobium sp.]|nr:hypothetical protein [Sphingobium sp.]
MPFRFDPGIFSVEGLAGEVLPGTRLFWYASGTSTPLATYADPDLEVANTNPVLSAADGRLPPIWLQDDDYKLVVGLPDGTIITRDPIRNPGSGVFPSFDELSASDGSDLIGFKQTGTGAAEETVQTALRRSVWVDQYKQVIDADDTQCIVRAISSGASKLLFQNRDYLVTGEIIIPGLKFLRGDGMGCTRIVQMNMTANLLKFAMVFAQAGGISDITLTSNVASFGDSGSTGTALIIENANDNFVCERFDIISYNKQITFTGGYQAHFRDFRCLFFTDHGIKLDAYSAGHEIAGTQWQSGKISNFGFLGDPEASIGLWMLQGSGEFFRDIDITMVGLGSVGAPPVNSWVRFARFDNVLADSCYYEGWTWDGGAGGYVLDIEMKGCWAAGAGGGAFRPSGSERGAGMVIKGIALDDLRVIGGTFRDNDCGGVDIQGGSNVRFSGTSISRNSRRLGYNNVYPGVRVRANVSNWSFQNCRIGNFSLGVFDVQQAENFVIETGASANFTILGCDLSNPGPGKQPFLNGSTSTNFTLSGNSPRRAAPLNLSEQQPLSNLCSATIAAGASSFVGPNGNAADAFSSAHIIDRPGVITRTKIAVPSPPGAGQSYTYTVYLNGNPTGMTGQITGSAQAAVIEAAFLVAENDTLATLVAASAGAAVVRHNVINIWSP